MKFEPFELLTFEILKNENKSDLIKYYNETRKKLIAMIDSVLKVIIHARINGWNEIEEIWNVIGFILFLSLDIKTDIELLIFEEDIIKKFSIIRTIYTQIYESVEDLEKILGKQFLKSITGLCT